VGTSLLLSAASYCLARFVAASGEDHANNRGLWYDLIVTDPQDLRAARAKSRQCGAGGADFFLG
jgi:hypothetical protein